MRWLCACQPRPSPERKVSTIWFSSSQKEAATSKAGAMKTGLWSSARSIACAGGSLVGEPLADIALANPCCVGERHRRTGAEVGHRLIKSELAPHIDQHAGKSGAQVGNDLAGEGFDLARCRKWCKLGHDPVPLRSHGTAGSGRLVRLR